MQSNLANPKWRLSGFVRFKKIYIHLKCIQNIKCSFWIPDCPAPSSFVAEMHLVVSVCKCTYSRLTVYFVPRRLFVWLVCLDFLGLA